MYLAEELLIIITVLFLAGKLLRIMSVFYVAEALLRIITVLYLHDRGTPDDYKRSVPGKSTSDNLYTFCTWQVYSWMILLFCICNGHSREWGTQSFVTLLAQGHFCTQFCTWQGHSCSQFCTWQVLYLTGALLREFRPVQILASEASALLPLSQNFSCNGEYL